MKIMSVGLNSHTDTMPRFDVHERTVYWLQGATLCWMIVECGVALVSANSAHSPALLAFGADSLIELLSAVAVLLQFTRWIKLTAPQAARIAGVLLFILAGVVLLISLGTLLARVRPETSCVGIGITMAALIVMPFLAWGKRKTAHSINNRALAADAVQSATCAYLAAITLFGLALNALWHFRWADPWRLSLRFRFLPSREDVPSKVNLATAVEYAEIAVNRSRQLGALVLLLVWSLVPAMACTLPDAQMTPAERACCVQMQRNCVGMDMPASHPCCQKQVHTEQSAVVQKGRRHFATHSDADRARDADGDSRFSRARAACTECLSTAISTLRSHHSQNLGPLFSGHIARLVR